MRAFSVLAGIAAAVLLSATAVAQELPAEVMDNYSAFQTAAADNDWPRAARAITQAAEAGDRLGIDAASRMVLWENAAIALVQADMRQEAVDAMRRAVVIGETSNASGAFIEMLYRFMHRDLARGDQVLFLQHSSSFLTAIEVGDQDYTDYEMQILPIRLTMLEPETVGQARALSDEETGHIARLHQLADAGSVEDAVARRRQIWSLIASEQWDEALAETIEALSVLPVTGDHVEYMRNKLYSIYHVIMIEGFNNRGDAANSLPVSLRPGWCSALQEEPFVVSRELPRISLVSRPGETLEAEINYIVGSDGTVIDATANLTGGRQAARYADAMRDAVGDWRWRPQCHQDDTYRHAGVVRFERSVSSAGQSPASSNSGSLGGRGRLLADEARAVMNGWRQHRN